MEFGPGRNLATAIDEAVAGGADALAVAGGDGSLATAAAAALAYELPFVCVPAGTRNHFARDLGLIRPIQSPASTPSATASRAGSTSER